MPKFRVPSPSLASIAFPNAQSKKTSRRIRAHRLDKAKAAVKEAAKRAHKTKQLAEPCVAYVGNIGPGVDESALVAHFSSFGKILSAKIHCCGGVAMTVKPPPASYHQNMRVRQYAMVVFQSKPARQTACKQENILDGRKLVVSTAISDLPEVQEKIDKRLGDYRSRMASPDPFRVQGSTLKSLKLEPTVLLDPGHDMQRNRFQCLGLSIREGIM